MADKKSSNTSLPVQLAIYDLSGGMAREFLGTMLGPNHGIDLIPHTGILFQGREYFFGQGIHSEDNVEVFRAMRGIHPLEIVNLGSTTVTPEEFKAWCQREGSNKFHPSRYDLFENNCNHFSHDAALRGLKLPRGVPSYILDVPRKVMASPLGQMVRPFLDQMQIRETAPVGGNNDANAFMGGGDDNNMLLGMNNIDDWTAPSENIDAMNNPWAAMGDELNEPLPPLKTPLMDQYCGRPLLSQDTKALEYCSKHFQDNEVILQVIQELSKQGKDNKDALSESLLQSACVALLQQYLQKNDRVIFALMVLRLLILHDKSQAATRPCLDWMTNHLTTSHLQQNNNSNNPLESVAARSMAWCCLSNHAATAAAGNATITTPPIILKEELIDIVLQDLNFSKRKELKQSVISYIYNAVLYNLTTEQQTNQEELGDAMTAILCGVLEGLTDDEEQQSPDPVTTERRFWIIGLFIKHSWAATRLIMELGMDCILIEAAAAAEMDGNSGNNNSAASWAKELYHLLEHRVANEESQAMS